MHNDHNTNSMRWLVAGLCAAAALTACGGGGGGSSSTGNPTTTTTSVVPASWVGTWKSVNWIHSDGTCYASYSKATAAGGGSYYGAGFNEEVMITSDGALTDVQRLYNDDKCTDFAGTVTQTGQISNLQTKTEAGYTDAATFVWTVTGSTLSHSGGTGFTLAELPASSGSVNLLYGLNASGQLCSGHDTNDANGYPTFSGSTAVDWCGTKQ